MQEGVRSELLPAVLAATESLLQAGEVFKKDDSQVKLKLRFEKVRRWPPKRWIKGGHFFLFANGNLEELSVG